LIDVIEDKVLKLPIHILIFATGLDLFKYVNLLVSINLPLIYKMIMLPCNIDLEWVMEICVLHQNKQIKTRKNNFYQYIFYMLLYV
jgi:hypothetical protein